MTKLRLVASVLARMGIVARWALVGLGIGTVLAVVVPAAIGHRVLTELTGSMHPVLRPGDVVVVAPLSPRHAKPGDVVTFPDPENPSRLITHRVVRVTATGGKVSFVTKGDANNDVERWSVASNGKIGRATYRLPKLGYLFFYVRTPVGRLALLVPTLAWGAYELRRIWRRDPSKADRWDGDRGRVMAGAPYALSSGSRTSR